MEHKLSAQVQAPHESIADRIMNEVLHEEIPEFLRYLHKELTARFELMASEAEAEFDLRRRRYIEIRDAHEPTPTQSMPR